MSTETIHIALVDDHQLFRKGIEAMLHPLENMEVVYESGNALEFLDWLQAGSPLPELILLDIEMPLMNGIELMEKLRQNYPSIRVIVLSMHFRQSIVANLVENG